MPVASRILGRTKGKILTDGECVRLASRVQVVESVGVFDQRIRGRAVLALTDRRLLLTTEPFIASRARLVAEWPTGGIRITLSKRKLGSNLIHVVTGDGERLSFEWVDGHKARQWATYRFRQ